MIPNNDGIDIDGGSEITISNCQISTGDDGICPKTGTLPLTDVTVTGCTIKSKSGAIKFGTSSNFDFRNIVFSGIIIEDSHRGLGIQLRDSGNVENVIFSDVILRTQLYSLDWWGMAEPIYVTAVPRYPQTKVGKIKNITFRNIQGTAEHGIFIAGSPDSVVENLVFDNVDLTIDSWTNFEGDFNDYRPGTREVVKHPVNLVYMEWAVGVRFENSKVQWGENVKEYWGIAVEDNPRTVTEVLFEGCEVN